MTQIDVMFKGNELNRQTTLNNIYILYLFIDLEIDEFYTLTLKLLAPKILCVDGGIFPPPPRSQLLEVTEN